jgi:hypothetical protein
MPSNAPAFMRDRARLAAFDFTVPRFVAQHDAMAQNQRFDVCLCPLCRMARPFLTPEPRFCDQMDERERVS